MRIKLDENIPASLEQILGHLGHDVETVIGEKLVGCTDSKVWESAQREGRFLITQDLDFSDIRVFKPGQHHGILLIRLRSPGRLALTRRIKELFEKEEPESWKKGFVVTTDRKLRIRRSE
jgi:predicted nuclease of predicted toxin-antitoxin system